jgi:hypothetical protein
MGLHFLEPFEGMAAGVDELVAVYQAGGKEIDNDLYPQDLILVSLFIFKRFGGYRNILYFCMQA